MNRRNFLRSVILGSSAILVGEDMLNWKRKYFPGVDFSTNKIHTTWTPNIEQDLKAIYSPMGRSVFPPADTFSTFGQFGGRGQYFYIDMK